MSEPPIDRRYEDAAERQALEADNERLREAIYWALGERDEFPEEPPPLNGKWRQRYWWRRELRRRAFDVDDNGADQPDAAPEIFGGDDSRELWRLINAVDHDKPEWDALYALGCACQRLEAQVRRAADNGSAG